MRGTDVTAYPTWNTTESTPHSSLVLYFALPHPALAFLPSSSSTTAPTTPTTTETMATSISEEKRDVRNPILFECAWEVANKVGGIYTVIKTKVPVTVSEYGDRYTLIGPLSYKTAPMEVEAEEPTDPHVAASLDAMRAQGVKVLYGRWLIEGAPRVLLFDTGSQYHRLDEWKGDLWNLAGIPTPPNDHETNETILFGYLVAWFLGEVRASFVSHLFADKWIVIGEAVERVHMRSICRVFLLEVMDPQLYRVGLDIGSVLPPKYTMFGVIRMSRVVFVWRTCALICCEIRDAISYVLTTSSYLTTIKRSLSHTYSRHDLTLIVCLVRVASIPQCCHCSLPRMASWRRDSPLPKAPHRRDHGLHHPCYPSRSIPLRWLRRLLQQPPIFRRRSRSRKAWYLPPLLHRAFLCSLRRRIHHGLPHYRIRVGALTQAQTRWRPP